jgi:MYXO-CTERM domain-containing protein
MTGCQGVIDSATALKYSPGDISGLGDSWKDVGVTCTYTHVNDFGLTLAPTTATAMAGTTATFTVTTAIPAGNTAQSVALTITGLPAGVTGTFAPATVMSGATSTLTIQTAYDTPMGDIAFTVTGTGTATPHTAAGTLTVTAPPPDLTPPPVADMATGTGTGGNGNGDHGGGGSGCSVAGTAGGSPMSALLFVAAALLLVARQRRASVRKMTATSRTNV